MCGFGENYLFPEGKFHEIDVRMIFLGRVNVFACVLGGKACNLRVFHFVVEFELLERARFEWGYCFVRVVLGFC